MSLLVVGPVAEARKIKVKRLGPGVVLRDITYKGKPRLKIRTVKIHRSRVDDIRAVLGSGQLPGWERTSSISRRHRGLVAINGDFGRQSGRPVMAFANRWVLKQTPLIWGRNFALSPDGSKTFIGHPKVGVWLNVGGERLEVSRLNNQGPYGNQIAMFDGAGGKLEQPPKRSCSARLKPTGFPRSDPDGTVTTRYRVDRASCQKGRMFPQGGRVVSAKWGTPKAAVLGSLAKGATVGLGWSMGWGSVRDAIGGNPTLIEQGRIVQENVTGCGSFCARHPRTGVGTTAKGNVIMATVDGRQKRSVGMTLHRFARLFKEFGAKWALNLDGGGSTTMVVRGKVINRPSDGRERAVSSALVLVGGQSRKSKNRSASQPARTSTAWRAAASDVASTGGLAQMLDDKGTRLPKDLARASARARN